MKKDFKETKFGAWLLKAKEHLPELANIALSAASNPVQALSDTVKLIAGMPNRSEEVIELKNQFEERLEEFQAESLEIFAAEMQDRADARDMYPTSKDYTDKLAHQIMTMNLWVVLGLVCINVGAVKYFTDGAMIAAISNIIGMVINSLLNERNTAVGFYMGSSLGSKIKDIKNSIA